MGSGTSSAQEVLIGDPVILRGQNTPNLSVGNLLGTKKANDGPSAKTTGGLTLPFFDDFSNESLYPSTALWVSDTAFITHIPQISLSKSVNPPSKGVLTFDGNGDGNRYYSDEFAWGACDSLNSLAIDLSGLNTGSNVWLSFFLEPGGKGDKPEYNDSFAVFFDTTGNFDWEVTWIMPGDSLLNNIFTRVMIPLDKAVYFHSSFRMKFVSYGTLTGELDQWHLDYVYLNSNRSANDTAFNDVSIINFDRGILNGFTAVPADHIGPGFMRGFKAELHTQSAANTNSNYKVSISDPVGGNSFSGNTIESNGLTIPGYSSVLDSTGPFSDQVFSADGILRFTAICDTTSQDTRSGNDTIRVDYKIDSLYARDDGVSDIGYGLTVNRAFCQEFSVPQPDTITAVWIHFTPTVFYSGTSTALEGKAFYLNVWNQLIPDSILVQQLSGCNVAYPDEFNGFVRYELLSPKVVDSVFWVGIEQVDHMPIGIGFDRNVNNASRIYYEDAAGAFVNTTNQGTLMIRPEFGTVVIVSNDEPVIAEPANFTAYPNPINGGGFSLQSLSNRQLRSLELELTDPQEKILFSRRFENPVFPLEVSFENSPPAGIYFAKISGKDYSDKNISQTLKLFIP